MRTTDKLWIVLLFLCVFLLGTAIVKRFAINALQSADRQSAVTALTAEKEDSRVYWSEEGKRREFAQAEYVLPEKDFTENEETELPEDLEDEIESISLEEALAILDEIAEWERGRSDEK